MKVFGSNHSEVGSLSENLILNTAGKVKIRFGQKFVDLLDNQGNLNVQIPKILTKVDSEEEISSDGFYLVEENLYASVNGEIIQITGVTAEFISYALEQELDQEKISLAQKNIGLSFESLEDAKKVITEGIVHIGQNIYYIGNDSELQLTLNSPLSDINTQYFGSPLNKQCIAFVNNKWMYYSFINEEDIKDLRITVNGLKNLDPQSVINAALTDDKNSYVITKGFLITSGIDTLETYPEIPSNEEVWINLIGIKYDVTSPQTAEDPYILSPSLQQPIYKSLKLQEGKFDSSLNISKEQGIIDNTETVSFFLITEGGNSEGWIFDENILNRKLYKQNNPIGPLEYTQTQHNELPLVSSIPTQDELKIPDIRWIIDYCSSLEQRITALEGANSSSSGS